MTHSGNPEYIKYRDENDTNNDVKEGFCGACAAIPMALVGAGVTGFGAHQSKGQHNKRRWITMIIGVLITVISVIVAIYFLTRCDKCQG